MLRLIHNSGLPASFPLDPTSEFEPGMIAQLKIIGNDIVVGVSDGTAPLGIIEDVRTTAFSRPQIDEVVEVLVTAIETDDNGNLVNSNEAIGFLNNASIVEESFTSTISVSLNAVNGAIIFPAGSVLNYDSDDDGVYDSFMSVVNYIYRVPNVPGDDSTVGSGRVGIHYSKGFYATDQFDTRQIYPLNATLFVGLDGKLTTKQPTDNHPGIAFVTGPPSRHKFHARIFLAVIGNQLIIIFKQMGVTMDSMDQRAWDDSEVIKEFEKKMIKVALHLKEKVEAQIQVSDKMKQIKTDTESANKQMTQLMDSAKNLSDDEESIEDEVEEEEEEEKELTSEDFERAREMLLSELKELTDQAINMGNTKLAYKIERAIDELIFEE